MLTRAKNFLLKPPPPPPPRGAEAGHASDSANTNRFANVSQERNAAVGDCIEWVKKARESSAKEKTLTPPTQLSTRQTVIWETTRDISGPQHTLDEVVGCDKAKDTLHQSVIVPVESFRHLEASGADLKCLILLYGPAGTGKTLCTQALRNTFARRGFDVPLFTLTMGSLFEKYLGESEKKVRGFLEMGGLLAPCILVMEEVDAVFSSRHRSSSGDGNMSKIQSELLARVQVELLPRGVFLLATCNRPWEMDTAFIRRFTKVYVALPDWKERLALLLQELGASGRRQAYMIRVSTNNLRERLPLEDPRSQDMLRGFSRTLKNYSNSDVSQAIRHLRFQKLMDMHSATCWALDHSRYVETNQEEYNFYPVLPGDEVAEWKQTYWEIAGKEGLALVPSAVTIEDLRRAAEAFPASVPVKEVFKYETYRDAVAANADPKTYSSVFD